MIEVQQLMGNQLIITFKDASLLDETLGINLDGIVKADDGKSNKIILDLNGIIKINGKGYTKLWETIDLLIKSNREFCFENVHDNFTELINSLAARSEK